MAEFIAGLALIVSVFVLIMNYKKESERRHGEITRLRSDHLSKVRNLHQRLISILMHLETIRIEIRGIPDNNEKYESIEIIPKAIASVKNIISSTETIKRHLEKFETKKKNNSETLIQLQEFEHQLREVDTDIGEVEVLALEQLQKIHVEGKKEISQDS